jgi:hypothetical protein
MPGRAILKEESTGYAVVMVFFYDSDIIEIAVVVYLFDLGVYGSSLGLIIRGNSKITDSFSNLIGEIKHVGFSLAM